MWFIRLCPTRVAPSTALSGSDIAAGFAPVADQARDQLCSQGLAAERVRLSHVLGVRLRGQSYELPIDVDEPAHADVVQLVEKRYVSGNPHLVRRDASGENP